MRFPGQSDESHSLDRPQTSLYNPPGISFQSARVNRKDGLVFEKLRSLLSAKMPQLQESALRRSPELAGEPAAVNDAHVLSCWSSQILDGRSVAVFRPPNPEIVTAAVLFLHGHGGIGLSQNAVYSRHFLENNLIAVCPDGKRSWWLDTVSPEFDDAVTPQRWLLDSVLPFIETDFGIRPPRVALLGVSMGGQGVLQLSFRHASRFPVVAAISPAVDFFQLHGSGIPLDNMFPDAEAARQASVVLNLNPLSWPKRQFFCCDPADHEWFDGAARLGMKLSSSGILHERDLETSFGGHSWDYFNHMADRVMRHIVAGLQTVESDASSAAGTTNPFALKNKNSSPEV